MEFLYNCTPINRTIFSSLSLLVSSNQPDWDKKLPLFLLAYRIAVHKITGYSPFVIFRDYSHVIFICPDIAVQQATRCSLGA
ncbi:hypothetical protein TNCV_3697921 [Trichonephila clavipes]|uniref:Uncharacterized protein n=1 Tax=Trichonephila clavipes TaxID=2585209 RepID=A0A8X6VKV2_TRICX|nr:hypothetical protein TNCV_3697921 [Trichonephila clavipes]